MCAEDCKEEQKLKLHCSRSVLEVLLRQRAPAEAVRCARVAGIKRAAEMPFGRYADIAFAANGLPPPGGDTADGRAATEGEVAPLLSQWRRVVAYYVLRQLVAPLWEELLLLDRLLFLRERGHRASLVPLFDPLLSPRNYALVASKRADGGGGDGERA